jgi:dihydroorotase-like cyclic amidohydrolase
MVQKRAGAEDSGRYPAVQEVWNTAAVTIYSGVLTKRLTINQVVNLTSAAPAGIFGLQQRKGTIQAG